MAGLNAESGFFLGVTASDGGKGGISGMTLDMSA